MKERLVEDWLTSINERGYEVPFCQSLLAGGYKILRSGHSPTEHGKDIIAVSPDGTVCGYQLKTGDFGQPEVSEYLNQLNMLVEARPVHPGLALDFAYQPYLVTTGEFKQPAISLIAELNAGWASRGLPKLRPINGRQLHVDFVKLSSDFWPTEPPKIRRFRELYLANGQGDLNAKGLANFLLEILNGAKSGVDLERRVSACNVFCSYLLGEFSNQKDHWSVFQGWTICAAQIAWAGESTERDSDFWLKSFALAKHAALDSLGRLAREVLEKDALAVRERELDDYTRTRSTVALAAASCWQLITGRREQPEGFRRTVELVIELTEAGRFFPWGESAVSFFLLLVWILEHGNKAPMAASLLLGLIEAVSLQNCSDSEDALETPYSSPDQCLSTYFAQAHGEKKTNRRAVNSYTLLPLVLLAARRELRSELEKAWPSIARVTLKVFEPAQPVGHLLWYCSEGKESSGTFPQPQSWAELRGLSLKDSKDRLPKVLRDDLDFALLFMLAFPHRILPLFVRHIDTQISSPQVKGANP
jgi:hypothetical protein